MSIERAYTSALAALLESIQIVSTPYDSSANEKDLVECHAALSLCEMVLIKAKRSSLFSRQVEVVSEFVKFHPELDKKFSINALYTVIRMIDRDVKGPNQQTRAELEYYLCSKPEYHIYRNEITQILDLLFVSE